MPEDEKDEVAEKIEEWFPEKKESLGGCKIHPMSDIGEGHSTTCVEEITYSIQQDVREIQELWSKYDLGCAYIKELGLKQLGDKISEFKDLFKAKLEAFLDSKLACIKKLEELLNSGEIDSKTFVALSEKFGITKKDGDKESELPM